MTPETPNALEELGTRVNERFAAAAAARVTLPTVNFTLDVAEWFSGLDETGAVAVPDDWPQFPREQWVTYPNKRAVALLLADRLLDSVDELTDEQWSTLCLLMVYGGRERLA